MKGNGEPGMGWAGEPVAPFPVEKTWYLTEGEMVPERLDGGRERGGVGISVIYFSLLIFCS